MIKPQNWDNVQANTGDYKSISAGGYIAKINTVELTQTKTGKEVLVLYFDIAEGEFKGTFSKQYSSREAQDSNVKWPAGGTYRQLTEEKSMTFFKGMISAIEESNKGWKWNWNEIELQGKVMGVVMADEEYVNNEGQIRVAVKPAWIRSVDAIRKGDFKVPEIKRVKEPNVVREVAATADEALPY